MTPEDRLKKIENFLFSPNYDFQVAVLEAMRSQLETGQALGFGKRTSQDSSALIEMYSLTKGFRFPNMSENQRDAIVNPLAGLVIYNTDTNKLNAFTTAWEAITSA